MLLVPVIYLFCVFMPIYDLMGLFDWFSEQGGKFSLSGFNEIKKKNTMIVAMIYLSVFLWLSQIWLFVRLKHGSEIFLVQNAVVGCCDLFIFILCFHSPCVIPPVVGTWRDIFLHFPFSGCLSKEVISKNSTRKVVRKINTIITYVFHLLGFMLPSGRIIGLFIYAHGLLGREGGPYSGRR